MAKFKIQKKKIQYQKLKAYKAQIYNKRTYGKFQNVDLRFLLKCSQVYREGHCENLIKPQVIDNEISEILLTISAAEICIIRNLLEKYPRMTAIQLQELKVVHNRKATLLNLECGIDDYGTENVKAPISMEIDWKFNKITLDIFENIFLEGCC
ncbi:11721_t:CDS:1 [Gigaspora margarita]|uniref:11721_t:CDS:1 n=1 Tax=Gigaspora margarita TaxID=4874 RepID=A0ABN7ULG5_GIGMA|nr:11721_t:CDS:1 [Gigaspora margarita]